MTSTFALLLIADLVLQSTLVYGVIAIGLSLPIFTVHSSYIVIVVHCVSMGRCISMGLRL